jgi:ABC-2 type transport system permease protein
MAQARGLSGDNPRYLDFLAPGILAQKCAFRRHFLRNRRDLGTRSGCFASLYGQSSPAQRSCSRQGSLIGSSRTGTGDHRPLPCPRDGDQGRSPSPENPRRRLLYCHRIGAFSTVSLIIACIVRSRERFMGIGQVLTMPIFFASNAIYPIDVMPGWLKVVSLAQPTDL